ncbi:LuxR C-terminal-related transcriptional regulator [Enhygromyxa salina]
MTKQVAAELQISVATVKVHRARAPKLGASSAAELARLLSFD